ncbi:uncharacterized protein FTJAE_12011 [Fusarium tjaetaba]|uniref:Uncharacterized protein n=1 Tax=Fusarium tjaetaba TaxID=1567544 RepID=A0A8H5QNI0_9HYPO|nr:uncharacterized protein FTJAE_12011 [Fusarium tjaetaba]KAF5619241.1 hypothetical protein FTJAE_12011 [Fusarium tjaetaba]
MNQLPNRPKLGSLLAQRRPIINLSKPFRSLVYDGCEMASVDKSEILPWTEFTFFNILEAYGDILDYPATCSPSGVVPVDNFENHCTMAHACMAEFVLPSPTWKEAICLGKHVIGDRLKTEPVLRCIEATHLRRILPKHAQALDFGNEDHVLVIFNEESQGNNPFHATAIVVPSCTWESGSLINANRNNQPNIGPIEQLAACAKKTNTCFSFILGDREIVALQFFKAKAGKMGVY